MFRLKRMKKMTNYSGLRVEFEKIWNCERTVIPVVVGGLGVISGIYPNDTSLTVH